MIHIPMSTFKGKIRIKTLFVKKLKTILENLFYYLFMYTIFVYDMLQSYNI